MRKPARRHVVVACTGGAVTCATTEELAPPELGAADGARGTAAASMVDLAPARGARVGATEPTEVGRGGLHRERKAGVRGQQIKRQTEERARKQGKRKGEGKKAKRGRDKV